MCLLYNVHFLFLHGTFIYTYMLAFLLIHQGKKILNNDDANKTHILPSYDQLV